VFDTESESGKPAPVVSEIGDELMHAVLEHFKDGRYQPSEALSARVSFGGDNYAVLRNTNGLLAVFGVRQYEDENGTALTELTELEAWPEEIEAL